MDPSLIAYIHQQISFFALSPQIFNPSLLSFLLFLFSSNIAGLIKELNLLSSDNISFIQCLSVAGAQVELVMTSIIIVDIETLHAFKGGLIVMSTRIRPFGI